MRLGVQAVLMAAMICGISQVEAAEPRLGRINPLGGQRGTEVKLTLSGRNLGDAEELLIYDPGVEVVSLEPVEEKEDEDGDRRRIRAVLKIAPDCRVGEVRMRLRTRTGLSELQKFHVGALPVVNEEEPNTDFEKPQVISINSTVQGRIESEDADYFAIEAKKGDRISAEVFGTRIGISSDGNYFDPYLAILNADRFELAVSDDAPLVKTDSIVSIIAPEDGRYVIQLRDAAYNGNRRSAYLLHIGNFPRPTAVMPPGGKPGEKLVVTFLGDVLGPIIREITVPENPGLDDYSLEVADEFGVAPSNIPFRVNALQNVLEQEPNNDFASATPAAGPGALNGIIGEAGDIDYFKFTAEKGQAFDFYVHARDIRTGLDPVVYVHRVDNGAVVVADDDARRPDSLAKFTAPEAGEYVVGIFDHLRKGDPTYAYRLEITPQQPSVVAEPVEFDRYLQPQIVIPQGGGCGFMVNVRRDAFGGAVNFKSEDLPEGVRIECPESWRSDGTMPVVFYAAEDAPVGGKFSLIHAFAEDPNLQVQGLLMQDVLMVRGINNDRVIQERMNRLPIVVTETAPFKCWIEPPSVPIVQGGALNLTVQCEKAEGWDEDIRVFFLQDPPGISASRSITIPKGATSAQIPVNAAGNAAVRVSPICCRCIAKVGDGNVELCTPMVPLAVEQQYLTMEFAQGAVEQGKEVPYLVKVTHRKEFEGEATVELLGLPANASAENLKLTKETSELLFTVKAAADTPPGMSQNVLCRVSVPENGAVVLHHLGSGRLRVDEHKEPKADTPTPEAAPAEVADSAPPAAPLSRLEQLRLEQKQRAAQN